MNDKVFKYIEISFTCDNFNGGRPFELYTVDDKELNTLLLNEVFVQEHYKSLVDFCRDIKNPVILDIGAHVGMASIYFSQLKDAKIYAVEPSPISFYTLQKNAEVYKNITPINYAVTGVDGIRNMGSLDKGISSESLFLKGANDFTVRARAIDHIIEEFNLDHIDAIKIDVEGAEYEILMSKGFKNIASKVDFIVGESHHIVAIPDLIKPILEPLGFKVEFLPIVNMKYHYDYSVGGDNFSAQADLKTLFKAVRIKN